MASRKEYMRRQKEYKYLVSCKVTVIARDAEHARALVKAQLETADHEEDPEHMSEPYVEPYSKYNVLGSAKRVRFNEGGMS